MVKENALEKPRHIAEIPLPAMEERAVEVALLLKTLAHPARLMLACPFLVDGRCSIYAVRPFRCRGIHSRDADYCKWKLEHIDEAVHDTRRGTEADPLLQAPVQIMDAGLTGLAVACQEAGLPAQGLELTAAMRVALR